MKTDEILKILGENLYKNYWSWESMGCIPEEEYKNFEEVASYDTNPRRDYLGTKTVIKNKVDDRYFFVEIYGNEMEHEFYDFGEVKPVEKTIITYERVK